MKKPVGKQAEARFHAIMVAGRKKLSVYSSLFYFARVNGKGFQRNSFWPYIKREYHGKSIPRKLLSIGEQWYPCFPRLLWNSRGRKDINKQVTVLFPEGEAQFSFYVK